jgi:hypothetical protein
MSRPLTETPRPQCPKHPSEAGFAVYFRNVLQNPNAERNWNRVVGPIPRGPVKVDIVTVRDELPHMADPYLP